MNKIMKIFFTIIVIFIILMQISCVFAERIDTSKYDPSTERNHANESELDKKAEVVLSIIRGIGIIVSVASLIIIGIREVTASAEEKSIIKQAMPGYILGAIMVFAITMIPTLVYNFAKDI